MRLADLGPAKYLLIAATCALPGILIFSSFRTFRELDEQKQVYLRHRVAQVVAKLETLDPASTPGWLLSLQREEPNLRDLRIISRDSERGKNPVLEPIWQGEELYRTEFVKGTTVPLYRAYVPFHGAVGLQIAEIDLDGRAADFLVVHARHNIMTALAGGAALIVVSLYAIWIARRTAALERRQVELEHLARLGRLSAVLAHEIRNPLGTIKGFTQLAAERADPATAEMLDPVLSETARLENLVNDLLAYGRPPEPELRVTEWNDVAGALERYIAQNAGTELRVHVEKADLRLRTDPAILIQILINLVKNAIEATAGTSGGEVRVKPNVSGLSLRISVGDNGPGIAAGVSDRIFEPFYTTKASGSGLGLSISKQLAHSLGGDLTVQSGETAGTECSLLLREAVIHTGAAQPMTS